MFLSDAEVGDQLYLVEVEDQNLEKWLSKAGMEVGEPVWKNQREIKKEVIWIDGGGVNYFFSPNFASGFLVRRSSGQICSLDLVEVGELFNIHGHWDSKVYHQIQGLTKLSGNSQLRVIKTLSDLDFLVSMGNEDIWLNSEIAFNIWGYYSDRLTTLGSMMVGYKFVPKFGLGGDTVKNLVDKLKMDQITTIKVKSIVKHKQDETGLICVLKNQSGNMVTVPGDAAKNIIVRLCDICWACGLCR